MSYVDLMLNIASLLIWLNWRAVVFIRPASALSIASAIKPANKLSGSRHWRLLGALVALVCLRAVFYWQFGPSLDWTPQLKLGVLVISFQCESFLRMLLFSGLSFLLTAAVFYFCLLFLAAVNHKEPETDEWQKNIRLHLGLLTFLPAVVQLILPFVLTALVWPACYWVFFQLHMMPVSAGFWPLVQQSLVVGLGSLLAWKYFLVGLLLLHLLNAYIYFGGASFWNFIAVTGRNTLWWLRWLRLGKLDLAPLIGMALLVAGGELLSRWLPVLYQKLPL
jgi:hypothetical protein